MKLGVRKLRCIVPFRSEAQRRYLWMRHPEIAKRWSKKYGSGKGLPKHVKKKAAALPDLDSEEHSERAAQEDYERLFRETGDPRFREIERDEKQHERILRGMGLSASDAQYYAYAVTFTSLLHTSDVVKSMEHALSVEFGRAFTGLQHKWMNVGTEIRLYLTDLSPDLAISRIWHATKIADSWLSDRRNRKTNITIAPDVHWGSVKFVRKFRGPGGDDEGGGPAHPSSLPSGGSRKKTRVAMGMSEETKEEFVSTPLPLVPALYAICAKHGVQVASSRRGFIGQVGRVAAKLHDVKFMTSQVVLSVRGSAKSCDVAIRQFSKLKKLYGDLLQHRDYCMKQAEHCWKMFKSVKPGVSTNYDTVARAQDQNVRDYDQRLMRLISVYDSPSSARRAPAAKPDSDEDRERNHDRPKFFAMALDFDVPLVPPPGGKTVTKRQIANAIAEELDMAQVRTLPVVSLTLDKIADALLQGHRVELRNFGVFEMRRMRAKAAVDPRDQRQIIKDERFVVKFRPSRRIHSTVKGRRKDAVYSLSSATHPNARPIHLRVVYDSMDAAREGADAFHDAMGSRFVTTSLGPRVNELGVHVTMPNGRGPMHNHESLIGFLRDLAKHTGGRVTKMVDSTKANSFSMSQDPETREMVLNFADEQKARAFASRLLSLDRGAEVSFSGTKVKIKHTDEDAQHVHALAASMAKGEQRRFKRKKAEAIAQPTGRAMVSPFSVASGSAYQASAQGTPEEEQREATQAQRTGAQPGIGGPTAITGPGANPKQHAPDDVPSPKDPNTTIRLYFDDVRITDAASKHLRSKGVRVLRQFPHSHGMKVTGPRKVVNDAVVQFKGAVAKMSYALAYVQTVDARFASKNKAKHAYLWFRSQNLNAHWPGNTLVTVNDIEPAKWALMEKMLRADPDLGFLTAQSQTGTHREEGPNPTEAKYKELKEQGRNLFVQFIVDFGSAVIAHRARAEMEKRGVLQPHEDGDGAVAGAIKAVAADAIQGIIRHFGGHVMRWKRSRTGETPWVPNKSGQGSRPTAPPQVNPAHVPHVAPQAKPTDAKGKAKATREKKAYEKKRGAPEDYSKLPGSRYSLGWNPFSRKKQKGPDEDWSQEELDSEHAQHVKYWKKQGAQHHGTYRHRKTGILTTQLTHPKHGPISVITGNNIKPGGNTRSSTMAGPHQKKFSKRHFDRDASGKFASFALGIDHIAIAWAVMDFLSSEITRQAVDALTAAGIRAVKHGGTHVIAQVRGSEKLARAREIAEKLKGTFRIKKRGEPASFAFGYAKYELAQTPEEAAREKEALLRGHQKQAEKYTQRAREAQAKGNYQEAQGHRERAQQHHDSIDALNGKGAKQSKRRQQQSSRQPNPFTREAWDRAGRQTWGDPGYTPEQRAEAFRRYKQFQRRSAMISLGLWGVILAPWLIRAGIACYQKGKEWFAAPKDEAEAEKVNAAKEKVKRSRKTRPKPASFAFGYAKYELAQTPEEAAREKEALLRGHQKQAEKYTQRAREAQAKGDHAAANAHRERAQQHHDSIDALNGKGAKQSRAKQPEWDARSEGFDRRYWNSRQEYETERARQQTQRTQAQERYRANKARADRKMKWISLGLWGVILAPWLIRAGIACYQKGKEWFAAPKDEAEAEKVNAAKEKVRKRKKQAASYSMDNSAWPSIIAAGAMVVIGLGIGKAIRALDRRSMKKQLEKLGFRVKSDSGGKLVLETEADLSKREMRDEIGQLIGWLRAQGIDAEVLQVKPPKKAASMALPAALIAGVYIIEGIAGLLTAATMVKELAKDGIQVKKKGDRVIARAKNKEQRRKIREEAAKAKAKVREVSPEQAASLGFSLGLPGWAGRALAKMTLTMTAAAAKHFMQAAKGLGVKVLSYKKEVSVEGVIKAVMTVQGTRQSIRDARALINDTDPRVDNHKGASMGYKSEMIGATNRLLRRHQQRQDVALSAAADDYTQMYVTRDFDNVKVILAQAKSAGVEARYYPESNGVALTGDREKVLRLIEALNTKLLGQVLPPTEDRALAHELDKLCEKLPGSTPEGQQVRRAYRDMTSLHPVAKSRKEQYKTLVKALSHD